MTSTPSGSVGLIFSTASLTAEAVEMALAPDASWMAMPVDGWPLYLLENS